MSKNIYSYNMDIERKKKAKTFFMLKKIKLLIILKF